MPVYGMGSAVKLFHVGMVIGRRKHPHDDPSLFDHADAAFQAELVQRRHVAGSLKGAGVMPAPRLTGADSWPS